MKELFKKINMEKMSEIEKQSGLESLQTFISKNPIAEPWYEKVGNKIISPFSGDVFLHHKILASAFVIVLLVSATGGTSFVASKSLPGDTLYPIKINLNEKVETFTAISPESKASVEATHIDERLSEVEKLSAQNKLDSALRTQIENKFSQDLQKTMTSVNALNNTGNKEGAKQVKVKIENSLQKHKKNLDEILENKTSERITRKTSEAIQPKAQFGTEDNTNRISTFSATMAQEATSTTPKIERKEIEKEDEDTPLLNETLIKISKNREED